MNTNKLYRSGTSFMMVMLFATLLILGSSISAIAQEKCNPPIPDFSAEPTEGCNPFVVYFTDLSTGAITSWHWDFGDGTTSLDVNPQHTYAHPGSYKVTLSISGPDGGNSITKFNFITVYDLATSDFSYNATSDCYGASVDFQNLSTNATSWIWDFGDGTTSTNENPPTHYYQSSGTYTVTLTATNLCGPVIESKEIDVTVMLQPVAEFYSDLPEVCVDSDVMFFDDSQNADNWFWDFGDGQTSIEQNPVHKYTQAGVYTVSLTVRNECGEDTETKLQYIHVKPNPEADFTSNKTETCTNEVVSFTDLSIYADTWHWDFGDGTTSSDQNPTHTYTSAGVYTVSLYVTNGCGTDTEIKMEYVSVSNGPTADFSPYSYHVCVANEFDFTDLSTDATSWDWDFGDGSTSTAQNPQHTYIANGTYDVTLTVSNSCGSDAKTITLMVNVPPDPVADYSYKLTQYCSGGRVNFTNLSTDANSVEWDFGDGDTSTDENPEHFYNIAGTYNVTLTAFGTCNNDTETKSITVTVDYPPYPDFTANVTEACIEEVVQFTDLSHNADSWEWDFGDGSPLSTDQNPTHSYTSVGSYTVSLTAYNECGSNQEVKELYITITDNPIADFSPYSYHVCVANEFDFTDLSTDATSWDWDFGDGSTSTIQNPQHTYIANGTYDVTLTVSNSCGSDSKTITLNVNVPPDPVADYTFEVVPNCYGGVVTFTDESTNVDSWEWDFGDGTPISHDQNPVHNYGGSGDFTVTLTVYNDCGEDDISYSVIITSYPEPIAEFSADNTDACVDKTVTFTDQSTGAVSWYWDFGDGQTSTVQHPTHVYANVGIYTVTLEIYDVCDKYDIETKELYIDVQKPPVADFSPYSYHECLANEFDFTDLSTDATSWNWDFGDGSSSTAQNPQHTYAANGTYIVSLMVSNSCGTDTKSITLNINVPPDPVADYSYKLTEYCSGGRASFTNLSTDANSVEWDFDDGDISTDENPEHFYDIAGTYNVTLTAFGECNSDTETKSFTITVGYPPTAQFSSNVTEACVEEVVNFTDLSHDADSWEWNFGDGATSTLQNPTHSYASVGTYTVSLIVFNDCGSDQEVKELYITVIGKPTADFDPTPQTGQAPLSVYFGNNSTGATSYEWNFGDGSAISTTENPTHIFNVPGTYDILLTSFNKCGSDEIVKSVIVYGTINADFKLSTRFPCEDDPINFTDLSTGTITSWLWDFGDGNTSTVQHPSNTYASSGNYNISLTVSGPDGSDVEVKTTLIEIQYPPQASFLATPDNGESPLTVHFTNTSVGATSQTWDFGDGATSTAENPTHIYTTPGQYDVVLVSSNICGDDEAYETIIVVPPITECEVDFGSEVPTGCGPLTVYFDDQTDCEVLTWFWDFGDGNTSTEQYPQNTYANPGLYTVSLTITFDGGTDTETKTNYITVKDSPTSAFTAIPTEGDAPLPVKFTDQSVGATSWSWDFDDGTPAVTVQNPTHIFSSAGIYTVTLTSTNECGSEESTEIITVTDPTCQADFDTEVPTGCGPLTVYFYDQTDCEVLTWFWDFGDGNTSTEQYPQNTYANPGLYTVSLTITFDGGTDTETKINFITVKAPPTSAFNTNPTQGDAPLMVEFTDQSIGATSWSWDFDDGTPVVTDQHPKHIFTAGGTYNVILTSTNECGSEESTETIIVNVPGLNADFSAEPLTGCDPLTVEFTDLSTGTITSWIWEFGDGTTSTEQNPSHNYTVTGDYNITLNVIGPDGTDVERKLYTFTIIDAPTADFMYVTNPSNNYAPVFADFTDISSGATSWHWDFGDGNVADVQNPSHIYVDSGHFTVTLTASNDCGSDIQTAEIVVRRFFAPGALRLFTAVDKAQAPPEDTLLYTVTIRNTENGPITDIIVHDTIPEMTAYIVGSAVNAVAPMPKLSNSGIAQATSNIFYDVNSDMIIWSVDTINALDSVKMEFRVIIDESAPDGYIIPNKAIITNPPDQYSEAEVTTLVIAPEIGIRKTAYPVIANAGDTITYTVQITNIGNYGLTNAILMDDHPDDFNYIPGSASLNGVAVISTGSDPIRFELGDIGHPDTLVLTYLSEIPHGIDYSQPFINTAILYDRGGDGQSQSWGPVMAMVGVDVPPLVITKRASANSGFPGDIIDFYIAVENVSNTPAINSYVLDTLPFGFEYIDSTTTIDQNIAPDPAGINPLTWQLGQLDPGDKVSLRYSVQLSTRIMGGINENIAWAYADDFIPSRATCRINIIPSTLSGSIRGKVVVDCGDGELDFDTTLTGTDIFLDDGSHSRVNNNGMFYFNTVRSGQRAVMIDTRDLKEKLFDLSDDQPASVFVYVHEAGESYVIFKVCPSQPMLKLNKEAALVPTATITKSASINTTKNYDSSGVVVDYVITVDYTGGAEVANLKIVDSLPDKTELTMSESNELIISSDGKQLYNEFTVGSDGFKRSIKYSLEDLDPGSRKFLENTIYLEGKLDNTVKEYSHKSTTATVAVGPLRTSPDADIKMNIIGAYFETSKAYLRPEAIPILEAIADSILKYSDVTIRTEGHCDYRRINTIKFPSNWELSEARALSVLNWLVDNHNIDSSIMSYEGFAATKPVDTGHSEVHWQQNRRVEVFIKGRNRSQVDYSMIPVNNWKAVTVLELDPINWDTVLVPGKDVLTQIGQNLWEVRIVVENVGYYPAENVVLDDVLPKNGEYVSGSATIDGKTAKAFIGSDGDLKIELDRVDRNQKIDIRYRFKAKPETNPTGASEATIEIEGRDKTVTHRSNILRFE